MLCCLWKAWYKLNGTLFSACPQLLVWLPILDNGEFVVHFMEQSSEAIVKYFCDEGYVLDGDATRSCVFDGITAKWVREDVPTCVRKLHFVLNFL